MTHFYSHTAHHLDDDSHHTATDHRNHRQPSTLPGGMSITVRLRVTVPTSSDLPDRVRLVVKERGAIFFPYRRKLASLPFDSWTRLPGNVWQGSAVQQVAMDVPKMLKKAQRKLLSLKLYCLHRRTVQHKAVGSLERLLHQGRYEELALDLHYPGCPLLVQASDAPRLSDSHEGANEPSDSESTQYYDAQSGRSDSTQYYDALSGGSGPDQHRDAPRDGSYLHRLARAFSGGPEHDPYIYAPRGGPYLRQLAYAFRSGPEHDPNFHALRNGSYLDHHSDALSGGPELDPYFNYLRRFESLGYYFAAYNWRFGPP